MRRTQWFAFSALSGKCRSRRWHWALRLRQVSQLTWLGRSMIYQMQAEGRFPQRIKLRERAVGWLESEVRDWLATRIETSRGNQRGAN
jgi:prophage regulatory protein